MINAIMPPCELVLFLAIKRVQQSWDQSRFCRKLPPQQTRETNIASYKELYSGLDFEIYYKYSNIILMVWVSFLFAPGLPILFPIGLFGLIVQYVTNRI